MKYAENAIKGVIFLIIGVSVVTSLFTENWSNLFVVGITLVLSLVPFFLERKYKICFSEKLKFGFVLFIFATLFLGEVNNYYEEIHWWDTALHFTAGLGLTTFGLVLLMEIYNQSELKSVPSMTTFFAFCFTGMMAAVWEVFEFACDYFYFGEPTMQGGLTDTMVDIIVALLAGLIVCFYGFRYLKHRDKNFAGDIIEETSLSEDSDEGAQHA